MGVFDLVKDVVRRARALVGNSMSLPLSLSLAVVAATISAAIVACYNAHEDPLGGPFGGALEEPVGPTAPGPLYDAGGGRSSRSNGDGATPSRTGVSGSGDGGAAPTWTDIYKQYLTLSTCGGAGGIFAGACHNDFNSKSSAYSYLRAQGQLADASTPMACLKGLGACKEGQCTQGNMPVTGDISDDAYAAIRAWIAAGVQNN
jgi:hypothetical protein